MVSKRFTIDVIISVYTGILATDNFSKIHEMIEYLVGEPVFTYQLSRVQEECAPWLLRRHPFLSEIDASIITADNYRDIVDGWIKQYGKYHKVQPIPRDDHKHIDPLTEAITMMGDSSKVIPVIVDDEEASNG